MTYDIGLLIVLVLLLAPELIALAMILVVLVIMLPFVVIAGLIDMLSARRT